VEVDLLVAVRGEPPGEQSGREEADEQEQAGNGDAVLQEASEGTRPVALRLLRERRIANGVERRGQGCRDLGYVVVPARTPTRT
jgi:hypothetical protein